MNGLSLPMNQGYPLRLIIPVRYGIKHLKRIGTLFFVTKNQKIIGTKEGMTIIQGYSFISLSNCFHLKSQDAYFCKK